MRVTPLKGTRPDLSRPVTRVILFGDTAYVARNGWKSYVTTSDTKSDDPGQLYASLAADTRLGSSVYNILALLKGRRGGELGGCGRHVGSAWLSGPGWPSRCRSYPVLPGRRGVRNR
jgi:hypothetical protein